VFWQKALPFPLNLSGGKRKRSSRKKTEFLKPVHQVSVGNYMLARYAPEYELFTVAASDRFAHCLARIRGAE
jgi:hypothetical protein